MSGLKFQIPNAKVNRAVALLDPWKCSIGILLVKTTPATETFSKLKKAFK